MYTSNKNLSLFYRTLGQTLIVFIIFTITFILYVQSEKLIDHAYMLRVKSYLLMDELRHTSDDLTRMARSYVTTGNLIHKRHYQEIIDIRNGKSPRPIDYQNVYWDLIKENDKRPRPYSNQSIPLLELMQQSGFTEAEFAKLSDAKKHSDALTQIEYKAMELANSDPFKAMHLLQNEMYHDAKTEIMQPIAEVYEMVNKRTLDTVRESKNTAIWVLIIFIIFGILLLVVIWGAYRALHSTLGGPLDELHSRIAQIGGGNFTSPITIGKGMEDSILGWLSETQIKLFMLDTKRKEAKKNSRRISQLYAALSQCNEAIIHSENEIELFPKICKDAVSITDIKMAWIGLIDEQTRQINPVAYYGSGTDYLKDLHITIDANDPLGQGPSGTVFRENHSVWSQDFQHDSSTAPWIEYAKEFGWKATAALPLHRNGVIIGTFNLYADEANVFDGPTRKLLQQMATNIDYALTGFTHENARKEAENTLRNSQQHLQAIIKNEPECVKLVDSRGKLIEMNPAGLAMLQANTLAEVQQHTFESYILPQWRASFIALHKEVMKGNNGTLEFEIQGLRGAQRWLETHAVPMRDAEGKITMLLGITRDITQRKESEQRIEYMANFDTLTGLPNRARLNEKLIYTLNLAKRNKWVFSLLFLDIDNFKDINDTLGHHIGDSLLIDLAQRMQSVLREEDTLARLGGDEFILLLPNSNVDGAQEVARKLLHIIQNPFSIEQYELNITVSVGIALYPVDGLNKETLFRNADAAMYRAKANGRNGYSFFTEEMQTISTRKLQLVNGLHHALSRNELYIVYQPQISLETGYIIGTEALLRWEHPEFGTISPDEFIPLAESSGLILSIGEWVLRSAVGQLKSWIERGMPPIIMAVNLSAVQFRHHNLPDLVTQILKSTGLLPKYLELELTESVAMNHPQEAINIINNLYERGIQMSIDDFGTGYSSLSYLKKFKVYKLKIDQSFVRDISINPEDKAIVAAIIKMADSLGLRSIAEGVETIEQLDYLRKQGCTEAQGYYFNKPLLAEQFERIYSSEKYLKSNVWLPSQS